MALTVSPNMSPVEGMAPSAEYIDTEEVFNGWPDGNVEASLDEDEPEEEEEDDEESEEEGDEEETEEEAVEPEEAAEEEEEETEDDDHPDLGPRGKARIKQLLEAKKAHTAEMAALKAEMATLRQAQSFDKLTEEVAAQRKIQEQAWNLATQERSKQEKAMKAQEEYQRFQMMGYQPGDFAHELAMQTHRTLQEFIESAQPVMGANDRRFEEFERQRAQQSYMAELQGHLDKSLEGLNVDTKMKQWLHQSAIDLAIAYDTTAADAVQLALSKANEVGVVPKRSAKPKSSVKPKAMPPKEVVHAVAQRASQSGRTKGPQTKKSSTKRGRNRDPEDSSFPEFGRDKEW